MKIEEGKFYRTRDGRKAGPMLWLTDCSQGFVTSDDRSSARVFQSDGTHGSGSKSGAVANIPDLDLVSEWVDEPALAEEGRFSHDRWAALVEASFEQIKSLATKKGGEYSGDDDRLLNFRRNGAALGLPMETVWAVYAGKHWDAIQQFIKDQRNGRERERLEPIAGRVDDLLVYLLLFKAMLEEGGSE